MLARDILPLGYALKLATVPAERQEEGLRRCFRPLFQDEGASRDQLEPLASLTQWIEKCVRMDPKAEQTRVLLPDLAEQVETAEQEKRAAVVAVSTLTFHTDRSDPKPILAKSWKRAEGKDRCKHARPGVIVLGPGQGTFLQVCIAKKACEQALARQPKQAAAVAASAQDLKRAASGVKRRSVAPRSRRSRRSGSRSCGSQRSGYSRNVRRPLKWTPALFRLLRHDMRVGEVFDEIVGAPGTIPVARYP